MRNDVLAIARKELARFFSNKASAAIAILLPGLLIFVMWSFMGTVIGDMASEGTGEKPVVGIVSPPGSVEALAQGSGMTLVPLGALPDAAGVRDAVKAGDYDVVAVFPAGFDSAVAAYDPSSGAQAPQVQVYFDSTNPRSSSSYVQFTSMLDSYESSLSNRFDVNAGDGAYDVSDDRSRAATFMVSIVPMILLILLFSGCMSVAAEAIAGEKERGTMATLLATPIKRSDIAWGKILALTLIGLTIAASSAIGIFASLPNLTQGEVDINIYGPPEYALLALVIFSTTLVIVVMITVVSALAKTTKEAQLYLTPLMIVVMAVGLLGMFGNGAQSGLGFYLIPLYNSVQCMIGIFTFDFQPLNIIVSIVANLVYTGIGVFVLQRMFYSERLMFAR